MTHDSFYYDLEANFRGTRDEIIERLRAYQPFLTPLFDQFDDPKFIDLGCGRGEWLELIGEMGGHAYGVDLDEGMLQDCDKRGLNADKKDAIAALKALPDGSQAVVSGFHIVEHLPFDVLLILIDEAFRVLKPGGLLIMETPNAENISVGAHTFHFDPTHEKPLPPGLLSFLPRRAGFHRSLVIRLQEHSDLKDSAQVALMDVIEGASPDYAVVAQKPGDDEVLSHFDAAFAADYGLTVNTLAHRFERGIFDQIDHVADRATDADQKINQLNDDISHLKDNIGHHKDNIGHLNDEIGHLRRRLDEIIKISNDHRDRVAAMEASTSWKITKPMRQAVRLVQKTIKFSKDLANRVIKIAIRFTLARPIVHRLANRTLYYVPSLKKWLRKMYLDGTVPGAAPHRTLNGTVAEGAQYRNLDFEHLSPRAKYYFQRITDKKEN